MTENINVMLFKPHIIMPLLFRGIFCFGVIFSSCVFGQKNNPVFIDMREALSAKPAFDWDIDTRNSFIASKRAGVFGIRAGVHFDRIVRLGLGYNFLYTTISEEFFTENSGGRRVNAKQRFHMRYGSIYGEYVYYRKNNLKMTIQMLFGAGISQFRFVDSYNVQVKSSWRPVYLYEPHMTGDYKLMKYFSVGAGLGYRIVYSPDKFSRSRLNSPIYIVRANILFRELYNALKTR